ncbi:MAG: DUF3179 domain-containing protein [Candidatus Wallbacteria bacterium]|nr:DUF3179 domain-containing protein [Candidatus Wallbacteria bacterium]
MVYSARLDGMRLTFGISGLLYRSNVVLYDRRSGSLWSQLAGAAISGKYSGRQLVELPSLVTTWASWRRARPDSSVALAASLRYSADPYADYWGSSETMFDVGPIDTRLPAKALVFGAVVGKLAKAYPLSEFPSTNQVMRDRIGNVKVWLSRGETSRDFRMTDLTGRRVSGSVMYWFAWSKFHPDTALWAGPAGQ